MKTPKVRFVALIVSAAFAISAEAGDRHRNNANGSQVAPSRGRSSGQSFSSGSGFRQGGGRTFAPSPRMTTRSMPTRTFSQRSTFNSGRNVASFGQRRFTPPETVNRSNRFSRFENHGNVGAIQDNPLNHFSSLN